MSFPKDYAIFFFLYNVTYLGMGIVMLAFGAVAISTILSFGVFTQAAFVAGPAIFIIVGLLKIILSLVGGANIFIKNKKIFFFFVVFSILLMFLTFSGAVVSFLGRPHAHGLIQSQLTNVFSTNATADADDISNLQTSLNCCGPTRTFDSRNGCTSTRPRNTAFGRGCLQHLSDAVLENLYDLGAIGMGFGAFEVMVFLVAMQHTEGSGI